jgi:regulatory factor X
LNPASFGKLVRVIFPGIQTRRLGVRGESKYHYVDLALINDSEDGEDARRPSIGPTAHNTMKRQQSSGPKLDFNSIPRLPADSAQFPPPDTGIESTNSQFAPAGSKGLLYADIYSNQYRPANARTKTSYEYELKFPTAEVLTASDVLEIELPDITSYLPTRTDPDSADNLVPLTRYISCRLSQILQGEAILSTVWHLPRHVDRTCAEALRITGASSMDQRVRLDDVPEDDSQRLSTYTTSRPTYCS